uniref:Uncharacterized protein n=1 Tax=Nelumbo nucifera TaxID=4432 RepID=A0A822ZB44_NELNU|nr:TPA_asm: hypothetical protein HUJ06_001714 [Nelumbo nucifera]
MNGSFDGDGGSGVLFPASFFSMDLVCYFNLPSFGLK